jgi:hypothetical protein
MGLSYLVFLNSFNFGLEEDDDDTYKIDHTNIAFAMAECDER